MTRTIPIELRNLQDKWVKLLKDRFPKMPAGLKTGDRTRQANYYAALEYFGDGKKYGKGRARNLRNAGSLWHVDPSIDSPEDAQDFLKGVERSPPQPTVTKEIETKKEAKETETMEKADKESEARRQDVKDKLEAAKTKYKTRARVRDRERELERVRKEYENLLRKVTDRDDQEEEKEELEQEETKVEDIENIEIDTIRDLEDKLQELEEMANRGAQVDRDVMRDLQTKIEEMKTMSGERRGEEPPSGYGIERRYEHEAHNADIDREIETIRRILVSKDAQPSVKAHLERHMMKLEERKRIDHHHRHHGFERAESEMRRIREEDALRARTNEDAAQHLRGFVPTRGHREADHTARAVHATDNPRINIQPLREEGGEANPVPTLQENDAYVMARDGTVPMNSIFLDDRVDPVAPPQTNSPEEQAQANADFEAEQEQNMQREIAQINEEQQLESVALMGETNADAGVITGVFNPSNIPSGREGQEAAEALVAVSRHEVEPQLIGEGGAQPPPMDYQAARERYMAQRPIDYQAGRERYEAARGRYIAQGGGQAPPPQPPPQPAPVAPLPSSQGADAGDRYEYDIGFFDQGGGVNLPTQDAIMRQLDVGSSRTHKEAERRHRERASLSKLKEEVACLFKVYEPLIADLRSEKQQRMKNAVLKSDSHKVVADYHESLTQLVRRYMQGTDLKVGVIVSADSIGQLGARGVQGQTTSVPAVPVGAGGTSAQHLTGSAPQYRLTKSGQDKFVHTSAAHQEVMRGGRRTFDIIESRKPQDHPETHPQPGRIPRFVTRARNPYPSIAIARNPGAGMALRIPGRKANHFEEF